MKFCIICYIKEQRLPTHFSLYEKGSLFQLYISLPRWYKNMQEEDKHFCPVWDE